MDTTRNLVDNYLAIWNETDAETRQALIARTWTDNASYVDPLMEATGHANINAMVAGFQGQFPGLTFRQVGETEAHHDLIRFSWELGPEDGEIIAAGTDVAVIHDGRLHAVSGFFDQAPVLDAA